MGLAGLDHSPRPGQVYQRHPEGPQFVVPLNARKKKRGGASGVERTKARRRTAATSWQE